MGKFLKLVVQIKGHVVVVLVILGTISAGNTSIKVLRRTDGLAEARATLDLLKAEQERLLQLQREAQSVEFVEREARDKLGLAKAGETVVVLPSEDVLKRLVPPLDEPEPAVETLPVWRRWLRLFVPGLEEAL